jgi:hypothetical protein
MRVIIAGSRSIDDYDFVKSCIESSEINITEVVCGMAEGVDLLGKDWADENGIKVTPFVPLWDAIDVPGAMIKINKWGKKYNAKAGFDRNQEMVNYAEALIAIQDTEDTNGTSDVIKRAKDKGIKTVVHKRKKDDSEYEYNF